MYCMQYIYIYVYIYIYYIYISVTCSFLLPGKTSCDSNMQVGDEQNTYEWLDQSQYEFASYQACVVQTVCGFFKSNIKFVRAQTGCVFNVFCVCGDVREKGKSPRFSGICVSGVSSVGEGEL